ncbi:MULTISPECIES: Bug family tripartite tricarboxylate transporter substrate binding protein [Burkholderiales]|uniref:Tripartite-type tricarboxylate transporter receptor subunit TctC n=1 Tax=Pigmentiphaga kullae TaxID=151784 RepID=A0A4Q7NH91_9BURK|nr:MULTISPECIES: tripartite tricarboxylate transporter substrate-binding protein [Pigmentiphaga]RZS84239.1 tripartite-type tricarboxylate transporter receptor subunit TctC [Pigmentiphaga kullae]GGX19049.1 MFS transporter [Pigmentiphaga litoralis]
MSLSFLRATPLPLTLALALFGTAASVAIGPAFAADDGASYPNRVIRFVVPYAPGGLPDTVARVVAQRLTEHMGQSVVVENKPGANGVIAAQTLKSAPRDGYTFLVTDGSMMSINPAIYKNLAYDPAKDFVPVSLVATSPLFLAANTELKVNTLQEFVALAKSKPGELNYGSSGIGSSHHLTMEAVKAALNLQISHVPFRGSGQSVPALVGNQVGVVFAALPSLSGFAENGKVKILATNSASRSALAPDIPAISEIIPGFNFAVTVGVLAATGTPSYAVTKINAEVTRALKTPEVIKQLNTLGIEPVGGPADRYAAAIAEEGKRYQGAIKAAGIKAE